MRVVVTGGAGFIGSSFLGLTAASRPSWQILNLDALTYAANPRNLVGLAGSDNYAFERVDIRDAEAVLAVFRRFRPELVVHFAAESHVDRSIHGPRIFVDTNIGGTLNLLEAAREVWATGEPGLFHHVSTDEVYGSLAPGELFVEETPYDPSSPYSATKAASDHLVRAYHKTFGLRVRISNCSNNYGPMQFPEKLIPLMILNLIEAKPLPVYGNGTNERDWLHVDDHCGAIISIIESGRDGHSYNIGGDCAVENIEIVRLLCRLVAEERGGRVEDNLALITFVKDRPGHDLRYAMDCSKIKRELGFAPSRGLESGLRETVRWYLDHLEWVEDVRSGEYRSWIDTNYGAR